MILGSLLGGLGGLWDVSGTSGLDVDFQGVSKRALGTPGILGTLKVEGKSEGFESPTPRAANQHTQTEDLKT